MIARVWRGLVARARKAEYVAYVDATGVAEYREAPGCPVSTTSTREMDAARVEVVAFSVWDTEASIQAFTGPNINAMVLYPLDQAFLLEPPTLVHYQVDSLQR